MAAKTKAEPALEPVTDCPACGQFEVIETGAHYGTLAHDTPVRCRECGFAGPLRSFISEQRKRANEHRRVDTRISR